MNCILPLGPGSGMGRCTYADLKNNNKAKYSELKFKKNVKRTKQFVVCFGVFVSSPTSWRSPGEYSTADRFSSAMTNVSRRNNCCRTQENLSPTALPGRENKGSDRLTAVD